MSTRLLFAAATVLALCGAGCDVIRTRFMAAERDGAADGAESAQLTSFERAEAGAPGDTSNDPTPMRGERQVEFPVEAQSASTAIRMGLDATQFADASVPVLAPAGVSTDQSQQYTDSYRTTPDGYFARWSDENFDVVINGTRMYSVPPAAAGATAARDMSTPQVSETETGMSVTFNRFGADYSIELVCRGAGDEGGSRCATEEEAVALVDRLVPVGGGGR